MRYEQRCSGCNWLESEGHAKDCVYGVDLNRAAYLEQQAAKGTAVRATLEAIEDADRLKALWLYPPVDIAFWKVAYPNLDAFRVAIDRYTKKKQDDKWGYPS